MKKRFLSTILCLAMIIGSLPIYVTADEATDIQNDEIQTLAGAADPDPNGEGTEDSPYLITSIDELKWFRDKVNNGNPNICARLMSDILLTEDVTNWTAIGTADNPYTGIFDGNNHIIKNTGTGKIINWNMSSETSGLFGYVDETGMIKSLTVQLYINTKGGTSLLTYENKGTIEQCTVRAIVGDATDVTEDTPFCNFAYKNIGKIKNCLSVLNSNVSNDAGFAETNSGTIENSLCAIIESGTAKISQAYAIAKTNDSGTVTNCYCTLYGVTFGEPLDRDLVTTSPLGTTETVRANTIKQIVWKLNNNGSTEGSNTDPWRYGGDVGFNSDYYPTLNPTDDEVTKSDGSETVTPHTHRVDGVIKEFAPLEETLVNIATGGYYYLPSDERVVNDWKVPADMTLCLNGYSIKQEGIDSISVPENINFTVTDCQDTGKITSESSTGVTVSGGTFVLDNVSVSGNTGIDYQSGTVKLSGKAKVTGNTQNIKLSEGQKLTFGILDESAQLGVTYGGQIDVGGEVEITDRTGVKYASQLSSDNEDYIIANGDGAVVLKNPEEHKHCICGTDHKEISGTADDGTKIGHIYEESVVFKPWNPNSHRNSDNLPTLPETAGSYYLTEDADLKTGFWEPDGDVKLCLNGHTVTFDYRTNSTNNALEGARLDNASDNVTVTDCGQTGTITLSGDKKQSGVRISNNAIFNLYNGTIKGFRRAVTVGDEGTQHTAEGTFNMYGGTLTENVNNVGPAVYANGSNANVNMYGGAITNNKTASTIRDVRYGGGVCVRGNGIFNMYGGEISNNGTADPNAAEEERNGAAYGGGVHVNGTFKMTGGKISGNTVTPKYDKYTQSGTTYTTLAEAYGGGVYVNGTFKMAGGEISNNTVTKGYGGGVCIKDGEPAVIENATISGNTVTASKDYKYGSEPKNSDGTRYYYGGIGGGIYSDQQLTLKNSKIENNSLINPIKCDGGDNNYYGGGAGVYVSADTTIDGCTISGNTMKGRNIQTDSTNAPRGAIGGAGVCVPRNNLTIKDSKITDNMAISDADAAEGRKLVGGGVLFCYPNMTFTVSGKVNISQNKVDGADGNVYLEKAPYNNAEQKQITADTLESASKIGVTAKTVPTDSDPVTVVTSENEIPDGVFTSDDSNYKTVLADDKKSVYLTENPDVAEVIHSDGTKTGYDNFLDAKDEAIDGETIRVVKNNVFIFDNDIFFDKEITLDLNGKKLNVYNAFISVRNNVTIKNGIIKFTMYSSMQTEGKTLITFWPDYNDKTFTLEDVKVQKDDFTALALEVKYGKLIAKGGSIDGGLHVGSFGDAELSDITITKAEEDTVLSEDGVILDKKSESDGGGIVRFLKSGYAYKKADGTFVDISANPKSISIGTTVNVSECTAHSFVSGKCKYCGHVCTHDGVTDENRVCGTCGATMTASVWLNPDKPFSETPIYVWYLTPAEAFASINPTDGQRKVTYYGDHTLTEDVEISGNVICYAMNKARLDFSDGKSFVVESGGRLQLAGGGYTGAVTVKSGGDLVVAQKPENSVGTLKVYDGSESDLLYSHFEKITIADGTKTLADMLPTTITLRHDDNSWASDTELSANVIENVTVVKKPFYEESIEADKASLDFNGADTKAKLTANITEDETNKKATTYKWYTVQGETETELADANSDTLEISFSAVGEYTNTYKCEITKDGYTRTVTKTITVTVNKGTPTYTAPTANTLTYNGEEQELITAGTASGGKMYYSTDGTNWTENVPKAKDADSYTVYYKITGDANHNDVDVKQINVTIAKRVLKGIKTGSIVKEYDGTTDRPTNFSITKVIDTNDTEIELSGISYSVSYDTAAAGENKEITLTVNLGETFAKNYVFEDGTTEKFFTLTGTIEKAKAPQQKDGELTIVNNLKRVYEYDLSALLADVPDARPYGEIKYGEPHVDIVGYYNDNENEGKATIDENGKLKLPIQSNTRTRDTAGTVTVKVTTENYYNYYYDGVNITDRDITLTVNVKAMNKIWLTGEPTLNPTSITYGQKLSDIALSGSLKGVDGNTVEGTFAWLAPEQILEARDYKSMWEFTPGKDFYMYDIVHGYSNFTVEPKDINGASHDAFNLVYNGSEQTPTAKVTVDGMEVTGTWSPVTNVSDKTTFTASGNFKGTIENVETGMKTKDISSAVITLAESPVYNGSEQTQGIESITVDGITLSESDYDISGNTATDVGEMTLTIQGKGNFSGTATQKWSIRKKDYDGDKTASANVRYDKNMEISVELPSIPSGASYGTVKLSRAKNPDGTDYENSIFPSGQRGVEGNKLYITVVPSQPGVYADITVPVIGATNYNDYDITIRVTCVNRSEVTFGGVEDNQTFVYDGTAKAPNIDSMTVSNNVDKNTLEVKYQKVTESGTADISANEIIEVGTYKATYSVPDENNEYMGSITYTFTIEPKSVGDAVITLADSPEYNGSEQTQAIESVTVGGITLSESDYDISDNKATDVKADGKYVLTIAGKGNFNETKTAEWNIKPTEPTESADKKTTARVRRGRALVYATVTNGEILGIDQKAIKGNYKWVDDSKTLNANSTEEMVFTPESANYSPITVKVEVEAYKANSSNSSSSSSGTTVSSRHIVNFNTNGGNTIPSQTVTHNQTATEPTQPTKGEFKFDGWYSDREFTMPYDFSEKVTKSITLYAKWLSGDSVTDPNEMFDDVVEDDWYYDDVKSAVEKGLFNGTSDRSFSPNESITRAMFVTVLYRAEGEPEVNGNIPFGDVAADGYYANAVIWAVQNGVVKGVSETEFAPNDKITREQIAAMMHRYAKYKGYDVSAAENTNILSYTDFDMISEYAIEPMQYAVGGGLMKGKTESTLNPKDNATRAEIAAILNRFIENNK